MYILSNENELPLNEMIRTQQRKLYFVLCESVDHQVCKYDTGIVLWKITHLLYENDLKNVLFKVYS